MADMSSNDANLHGIGIYIDSERLRPVHATLCFDKPFLLTHAENEKKAKGNGKSALGKRYPFEAPSNPELGGWDGEFSSLDLCIGFAFDKSAENDCLLRNDGIFIWSERTLSKLGDDKEKRVRFLLQMMQFLYSLMMGRDAITEGVPFQQYLGPLL